jgi:hypothetical protein
VNAGSEPSLVLLFLAIVAPCSTHVAFPFSWSPEVLLSISDVTPAQSPAPKRARQPKEIFDMVFREEVENAQGQQTVTVLKGRVIVRSAQELRVF